MHSNITKYFLLLLTILTCVACGNDDSNTNITEELTVWNDENEDFLIDGLDFGYVKNNEVSASQFFYIEGKNLSTAITISVSKNFELSTDNTNFNNSITISTENTNAINTIYIRFAPEDNLINNALEKIIISSSSLNNVSFYVTGKSGNSGTINYITFNKEHVAFGGGYSQTSRKTFILHNDNSNIETIKMYVKLTCAEGGCDEWDVFANVKAKDPVSGVDFELGRFITPYWNDNSQLKRGFEFDVTDFKSILTGEVELRIRTECWNARGYEVTIDFDFIEGTPDYPYYEVAKIYNYDNGSAAGIPYGIDHGIDLTRQISIPSNAESTHLRTFINGWGQAYPADPDGRRCAEWCYRTHTININNSATFDHYLGPLGCADNPVSNQSPGNWTPDRAGWCPGMVIPTRIDTFDNSIAGTTFDFEYTFEDWTNNETDDAYYPISTFVIVKSNTPIERPTVLN